MPSILPVARSQKAVDNAPSVAEPVSPEAIPFYRKARMSGMAEPQNLSNTLDVQRIQNALRAAERGNTWLLFTIFRDMYVSYTHLQAEWSKRKMVIVGQPLSLIPASKDADDVIAAQIIGEMIENCRNWQDGLQHLLDATLYPMSVAEKIYEPVSMSEQGKNPLRYRLKEIAPVSHIQLCFQVQYLPNSGYNPDDWEAGLRIYETLPNGLIDWSPSDSYPADPNRHIVHRGNLLSPTIPANFGGHMRAVVFWWLMATQDRDWWGLMMQKYGMPLIIGKVDAQQKDTVQSLRSAFALATQIGGLVVDKDAEVELIQMASTDGSNAHKIFHDFANCEVSKLVVGQVLSSTPKNTGLGSGMADQAEGVRDDVRMWDTMKLQDTLSRQLFEPYLRINGYRGRAPKAFWGGKRDGDAVALSKTILQLSQAGYRLTDEGITTAAEKFGIAIEKAPEPVQPTNKPTPSNENNN